MADNLVIVESPAKAKTIQKYLGNGYEVIASMGHVRDLPKSKLGVDTDNNFEPQYVDMKGKEDVIKELKKHAKKCEKIYLATDPDREGEAISWHIAQMLKLDMKERAAEIAELGFGRYTGMGDITAEVNRLRLMINAVPRTSGKNNKKKKRK